MTKRKRIDDGEWMPFFGHEFWESERVAAMSDSAVLLYSWLLWRQWLDGDLPGPDVLRRLVPRGWGGSRWQKLWSEVRGCFEEIGNGRLANARCAQEREIAQVVRAANSERARRGGLEKAARARAQAELEARSSPASSRPQAADEHPPSGASGLLGGCTQPDSTEPDKTQSVSGETSRSPARASRAARDPVAPEGEPEPRVAGHAPTRAAAGRPLGREPQAWRHALEPYPVLDTPRFAAAMDAWMAHHAAHAKTQPYTPQALDALLRELAELGLDAAVIALGHSVRSNWKTVHGPDEVGGARPSTSAPPPRAPLPAPVPDWKAAGFDDDKQYRAHLAEQHDKPEARMERCRNYVRNGLAKLAREHYPAEYARLVHLGEIAGEVA